MNMQNLALPYSPFLVKNDKIYIPRKYRDIFDSKYYPCTAGNWAQIRAQLIAACWLNEWYSDDAPTPKTSFYSFSEFEKMASNGAKFDSPKFVRLTSLSAKLAVNVPTYSFSDAQKLLTMSSRCQESIAFAQKYDLSLQVAVRDWHNFGGPTRSPVTPSREFAEYSDREGNEYRMFIFNDRVRAICSNDSKIATLTGDQIVARALALFEKFRHFLPLPDVIADIWLADDGAADQDFLVEFNSFGFWGQASAGLYDWHQDWEILQGECGDSEDSNNVDIRLLYKKDNPWDIYKDSDDKS